MAATTTASVKQAFLLLGLRSTCLARRLAAAIKHTLGGVNTRACATPLRLLVISGTLHRDGDERHCDSFGRRCVGRRVRGGGAKVFHVPQARTHTETHSHMGQVGLKKEKKKKLLSVSCKASLSLISFIPAAAPSSPNPENTISQVAQVGGGGGCAV